VGTLFKGAGPGTYWHANDARQKGFEWPAELPATRSTVIGHIARAESARSPYGSFTSSFEIALYYARDGTAGPVTAEKPGVIYQVEISGIELLHPVRQICAASDLPAEDAELPSPIHHDGQFDLILGVASPTHHGHCLRTSSRHPGRPLRKPRVEDDLKATVFALRDAEVLVHCRVEPRCVTAVYLVRDHHSDAFEPLAPDASWLDSKPPSTG
jgi:hypothetical protein